MSDELNGLPSRDYSQDMIVVSTLRCDELRSLLLASVSIPPTVWG